MVENCAAQRLGEEFNFPRFGLVFVVSGNVSALDEHPWLLPIARELARNCFQEKAGRVEIRFGRRRMVVKDDIAHQDTTSILANVNSRCPQTNKRGFDLDLRAVPGGMGISFSRRELEAHNGSLVYRATRNGIIRAVASWDDGKDSR